MEKEKKDKLIWHKPVVYIFTSKQIDEYIKAAAQSGGSSSCIKSNKR